MELIDTDPRQVLNTLHLLRRCSSRVAREKARDKIADLRVTSLNVEASEAIRDDAAKRDAAVIRDSVVVSE